MPTLHVTTSGGERSIAGSSGSVVSGMLRAAGIRLRLACGGVGACALCRIRVEEGKVNDPTLAELSRLSADELRAGIRLACQVRLLEDARIRIEDTAPEPRWTCLPDVVDVPAEARGSSRNHSLGVAVDLGTSQIRVALWDMETKTQRVGRCGPNPQRDLGADILTRLTLASGSGKSACELSWLARGAIGEALSDIGTTTGYECRDIRQVVIVGNTAMLCLLAGKHQDALLQPEFWTREIDCKPDDTAGWVAAWDLDPNAVVDVIPPMAGFVGADFLAAVIGTRLIDGPANSLLVDFGTNSEIGLWDGKTLWATSLPGGPAFEGSGISCGMPAEPGAIFEVHRAGSSPEFQYEVIGGGGPIGICGSGLVDIVAGLVADGSLRPTGRFDKSIGDNGVVIARGPKGIIFKQSDVDCFQRAKAATTAGIACLLGQTGLSFMDLQRVCVCGTFGRHLDIGNAQAVGLLPDIPPERIELHENAALSGCGLLLLSGGRSGIVETLKKKTTLINLARVPGYEERFVEELRLRPMRNGAKEGI